MPAKTQNIGNMLDITESLYEAAMVIAKRARQINEEFYQKKRDHQILEELEGGFDEDFLHAEQPEGETPELVENDENPIIHAQRDFMEGNLDYNYDSMRR